jgi:hypothetical protein
VAAAGAQLHSTAFARRWPSAILCRSIAAPRRCVRLGYTLCRNESRTRMSRLGPKSDVVRALFARSGNRCAFPGCTSSLVNKQNQFIAQVCHIEAAEPGGERYSPGQSDEERRGYANLLILCYPHHVETDHVTRYPVEVLKQMKALHEQQFERNPFKIDESLLSKIVVEMDQYCSRVEELHNSHIVPELAVEINARAKFLDLAAAGWSVVQDIQRLQNMLLESDDALVSDVKALLAEVGLQPEVLEQHPDHHRRFQVRNWEVLNLGLTNSVSKLVVLLTQMELKHLELFLQINPHDKIARLRLDALKVDFEKMAASAGYAD